MGLDISLYKAIRPSEANDKTDFHTLSEGQMKQFKEHGFEKYLAKKVQQYYDFEKTEYGDEKKWRWARTEYKDGKCFFTFKDLTHELAPIYNELLDNLSNKDYKPTFDVSLLQKYGWKHDSIFTPVKNKDGKKKKELGVWDAESFCYDAIYEKVDGDTLPIKDMEDTIIYLKEIAYQRKGLNSKFYVEYKPDDYYIFTKERMQYILDNDIDDSWYEGIRNNFKEKFVDSFVEGETVCAFDW